MGKRTGRTEVAIHIVDLEPPESALAAAAACLGAAERARAARFCRAENRNRWITAHGAMRTILAGYLDCTPAAVRFITQANGKPRVDADGKSGAPDFNLSHAGARALVAVSRQGAVGVDVEHVHEFPNMAGVVERFFAPVERRAWHALPAAEQTRAFFDCWTRKEALIKATGDGLRTPLDRFVVSFEPASGAALRSIEDDDCAMWKLTSLGLEPGYVGALAMRTPGPLEITVHPDPFGWLSLK